METIQCVIKRYFPLLLIIGLSACNKCDCTGIKPSFSKDYSDYIIFKSNATLDYLNDSNRVVKANVIYQHNDGITRRVCAPFSCPVCPEDKEITTSYEITIPEKQIVFRTSISVYQNTESVHHYVTLDRFNNVIDSFDSTNIGMTIKDKSYQGLSMKRFYNPCDTTSNVKELYYKKDLGLVALVFNTGDTLSLKEMRPVYIYNNWPIEEN